MARSHHRFGNMIAWFCHWLPVKPPGTWNFPVLGTVWLMLAAVPISATVGQEMENLEFTSEPTLTAENFSPLDEPVPWAAHHEEGPCSCDVCAGGSPWVNRLSGPYFRSGVSFVLGDGLLSGKSGRGLHNPGRRQAAAGARNRQRPGLPRSGWIVPVGDGRVEEGYASSGRLQNRE